MRIADYGTGEVPRPEHEADALFQTKFYASVPWRPHGGMPGLLQLVRLGGGDVLT